jgi:lipopolysaccharide export system protein LptC
MNWRAILTLVLLAGALLSGWAVLRQKSSQAPHGSSTGLSDYVLHDFELISLDDTGKESFTLRAPLLQETPGAKTMDLTRPLFLVPDGEGRYWQVKSRTGWVSAKRDEIRLRGQVHTTSPPEDPRKVLMTTAQLNLFPNTRKATSHAFVTITEPGLTMRGRGMRADLASRRFTLLSQTTARYVPSR